MKTDISKLSPEEITSRIKDYSQFLGATKVRVGYLKKEWVYTHYAHPYTPYEYGRPVDDMDYPYIICLAMRQKDLPDGHWLISEAESLLGSAVAGRGRFAEAEPLLLEGFAGMRGDPQTPGEYKRQARGRIVQLYESWGKPTEAAAWRESVAHEPMPTGAAESRATDDPADH